jgi:hypothetical protein
VWGLFGCAGEEKKIQKNGQGGAAGRTGRMRRKKNQPPPPSGKDRFRLFFFRVFFSCVLSPPNYQKIPPLKIQCSMVFIGKVLLCFQTSPSTFPFLLFSSFFCKFWFFLFFVFLKASNINVDSIRKINDFKINALKIERVRKTLENLNSF